MNKKLLINMLLVLVSTFLCVVFLEVSLRLFISSSQSSYGILFGIKLPPIKIIPTNSPSEVDRSEPYKHLIVDGNRITVGDLWGIHREDPVLGYAPKENSISVNGWWQANNLGARRRGDIIKERPNGKKRILVFGDSFANSSRVPQEDSWPAILESFVDDVEVLNFGVDGYSMAQSFLRYREVRNRVDHDLVLLMFAPDADLWRDINIRRDLAAGWNFYLLMPRFIIRQGELKLVSLSSKNNLTDLQIDKEKIEKQIVNFLKKYDNYYSASLFQVERFYTKFILYKLSVAAYHKYKKDTLEAGLLEPGSEALEVSHKIFETMHDEVNDDGNKFVLVIIPTHHDLKKFHKSTSYRDKWNRMISSTCELDLTCIDLTDDLYHLSDRDLDKGYDGTHYGPRANRQIAHFIMNHLAHLKVL